jgi:hypothetical protein
LPECDDGRDQNTSMTRRQELGKIREDERDVGSQP